MLKHLCLSDWYFYVCQAGTHYSVMLARTSVREVDIGLSGWLDLVKSAHVFVPYLGQLWPTNTGKLGGNRMEVDRAETR